MITTTSSSKPYYYIFKKVNSLCTELVGLENKLGYARLNNVNSLVFEKYVKNSEFFCSPQSPQSVVVEPNKK